MAEDEEEGKLPCVDPLTIRWLKMKEKKENYHVLNTALLTRGPWEKEDKLCQAEIKQGHVSQLCGQSLLIL